MILTGRVYEQAGNRDYYRVFVDRLWPRGLSKASNSWDEWIREIAPSPQLRKWFGHDPDKWADFRIQYMVELCHRHKETQYIEELEKIHGTVVLLYAAKDKQHNHAKVLQEFLEQEKNSQKGLDIDREV
ncbi:MAG: DUF488 domain-containing protein [Mangrovibacterium sp.]